MNLLQTLIHLVEGHAQQAAPQALQAHQAAQQQLGNNTPQARAYAANPQAPQFRNVDPAQFGYGPDNSGMQLSVAPNPFKANLGVSYMSPPQGGNMNPGYTPMQGSQGAGAYPQIKAFNSPQPQAPAQFRIQSGQEWQQ